MGVGCHAISETGVEIDGWLTGQNFFKPDPVCITRFFITRGLIRTQLSRCSWAGCI